MSWFRVPKKRWRGLHRRKRHSFWLAMREWLWPSMGLVPMLHWFELRIKRHDNASHRTALGVALGVAVTFTPFFGLHTLLVLLLAWLLRGNLLLGVLATFVGNPWTFPFITFWTLNFGHWVLGTHSDKKAFTDAPKLSEVWQHLPFFWEHYIWPMTVGGVPTGMVVGAVTYFFIKGSVRRFQKARLEKIRAARTRAREKRLEKEAKRHFKLVTSVFKPYLRLPHALFKKNAKPFMPIGRPVRSRPANFHGGSENTQEQACQNNESGEK